jgi:hypothetical protein
MLQEAIWHKENEIDQKLVAACVTATKALVEVKKNPAAREWEYRRIMDTVPKCSAQSVRVRWDDCASGAANSGRGPGEWKEMDIYAGARAPVYEVFQKLFPEGPYPDFRCGDSRIYQSWYEYELREYGEFHPDKGWNAPAWLCEWICGSYKLNVNPLPKLREMGFQAEGGPGWARLLPPNGWRGTAITWKAEYFSGF